MYIHYKYSYLIGGEEVSIYNTLLINLFLIFINIYILDIYRLLYVKSDKVKRYFKYLNPFFPLLWCTFTLIQFKLFSLHTPPTVQLLFANVLILFYVATTFNIRTFAFLYIVFYILTFYPTPLLPPYVDSLYYCFIIFILCLFIRNTFYPKWLTVIIVNCSLLMTVWFFSHNTSSSPLFTLFLYLFIILFYYGFLWCIRVKSTIFAELTESNIRSQAIFQNKQIGIMRIDEHDTILEYNEGFALIFNQKFDPHAWIGVNFFQLASAGKPYILNQEDFQKDIDEIKETRQEALNQLLLYKNGMAIERDFLPLTVDGVYKGAFFMFKNVSERIELHNNLQKLNTEFEKLAQTDALSGLFNRRKFDSDIAELITQHTQTQEPLSFILIDIDFFKKYNDYYGHFEGDICLQRVAKELKETMRKSIDYVYRYGGEEFCILLSHTNETGALAVSKRIIEHIHMAHIPHDASSHYNHVTVSIGAVTWYPKNGNISIQELIEHADSQLYKSKREGRNRLSFQVIQK